MISNGSIGFIDKSITSTYVTRIGASISATLQCHNKEIFCGGGNSYPFATDILRVL